MDELIENAPCGLLTLSAQGEILTINKTMLNLLHYPSSEHLIGKHFNVLLSPSSQIFCQLYLVPMMKVKQAVEEMFLTLLSVMKEEIPILLNASVHDNHPFTCVIFPIRNRSALEDALINARKMTEDAYLEKEQALLELERKQQDLLQANQINTKIMRETERDLQIAKKVQETALTNDITNDNIEILSYYHASKSLSGDIFGFYQVTPQKYAIILLDVMGHGVSSALITMSLQSMFQKLISREAAPEKVLQELDQYLHDLFQNNQDAWHYCTAIYLNIDIRTQTIEYINAGHPPAILQVDNNGVQQELGATNPPLGTFENILFKSRTLHYERGTKILLYTDGVSEAFECNTLNDLLNESISCPLAQTKETIQSALENKETIYSKYNNDDQCFILVGL
ncbi:SpoIIE family protein phosphatase [Solibacillus isronensis]|uniref:SpoIIE family protein phosphatase n=1 Tax=Solibacillus isronensis TaxID=412383 RepID=UPI00203E98A3|nr:SpoIIE family protein phosphatase [Solibacillus isronensis]MCM3722902.1 SpoIIE family protein phosphatase [Solibacillus isronensis]